MQAAYCFHIKMRSNYTLHTAFCLRCHRNWFVWINTELANLELSVLISLFVFNWAQQCRCGHEKLLKQTRPTGDWGASFSAWTAVPLRPPCRRGAECGQSQDPRRPFFQCHRFSPRPATLISNARDRFWLWTLRNVQWLLNRFYNSNIMR